MEEREIPHGAACGTDKNTRGAEIYLGIRDRGALSRGITRWRRRGTSNDHITRNREDIARVRTAKVLPRDRLHRSGRRKEW